MRASFRQYREFGTVALVAVVLLLNLDDATFVGPVYAVDATASASPAPAQAAIAGTQTLQRLDDSLDPFPPPPGLVSAVPTEAPATPVPSAAVPDPTRAPVVAATPATAVIPATCPASYFCYPRLGVSGQIVPYSDCTGRTDVGTAIRAYTCLSPNYLLGHAYTQMGKITGWLPGDVVYAYGKAFTVYAALTEQSCQPPILPLAPLSMQTSLSPNTCGPVLVVQAR